MGHRRRHHCGVYLLTHVPSGKCYVGKSLDVFMRWDSHLSNLFIKKHHNKHMQELFDQGSYRDWTFQILKLCKKTEVAALEKQLILEYQSLCGCNLMNIAGRGRVTPRPVATEKSQRPTTRPVA
jgi:group I intron endonuclease